MGIAGHHPVNVRPHASGIGSDEKQDVDYQIYTLENEYIQTQVLPAIGGKILSGYDKLGHYDFIYRNRVVKPALVGLAGPWISGGIEPIFAISYERRTTSLSDHDDYYKVYTPIVQNKMVFAI